MRIAAAGLAAALCLQPAALAADPADGAPPKTETERRLEEVLAELERQRLEIDGLKAKLATVESGAGVEAVVARYLEDAAKEAKKEPSKDDFRVFWKDTLSFETADRAVTLKIGGRVHYDMVFPDADDDVEAARGDYDATAGARRLRMEFGGTLFGTVYFQNSVEFAGTSYAWKDNYFGLRGLPLGLDFRAGYFKEPFSLEQVTSSNFTTFQERSSVDVFAPAFNHGAMVSGTAVENRAWWWAGDFWDGSTGTAPMNHNFTGRIAGLPYFEKEDAALVHLGLSVSDRSPESETHRYQQRPEAPFVPRLVDTGTFSVDDRTLLGFEGAWVMGPFSAQAEWMQASNSSHPDAGPAGGDPDYRGWYAYVSWFPTGESRAEGYSKGAFGRIRPKENWDGKGGMGAWEVALRYSVLDLDDDGVDGGVMDSWTLGVNWHLNPNARVMINYVMSNLHRVGDVDTVEVRFQVCF
ncbi:MAG: OprO/OprP family phosphate-selective porin [Planctomycetes bacterium]|nr:OprO/OprP family phosphate-selective porin [Planctomycetota bacterium]